MKLVTVISVTEGMKNVIKEELEHIFDVIEDMNPEPQFWETETGFTYITFSGKGSYDFDFSQEGEIVINCDCYRQSLIDGTAFFKITMPIGVPVNQLATRSNSLVIHRNVVDRIEISGKIESAESSQPERQVIPGKSLSEFLRIGEEMGLVEFHRPEPKENSIFTRDDPSGEDLWWYAWERFVSCRNIEYYS